MAVSTIPYFSTTYYIQIKYTAKKNALTRFMSPKIIFT
jgi:hypothetical protein